MCKLSKREREVLNLMIEGVSNDKVIASQLGIKDPRQIAVYRTKIRRKIAKAQKFLKEMKSARKILQEKKKYKGI